MARGSGTVIENNFVKGRISEATGLNFPENAVVDEKNCIFENTGRVIRRKGFDIETGAQYINVGTDDVAYTEYVWQGAAGNGENVIIVHQVGTTLYFYKAVEGQPVSANKLINTIDISIYGSGVNIGQNNCQFVDGFGYLFVANPWMTTIYLEYDNVNSIYVYPFTVLTRDTKGLEFPLFSRDGGTSPEALYQLVNQGWTLDLINTFRSSAVGAYPSSYDVWWLMKDQTEVFDPGTYANKILRGNSPAPKGSVILDEFFQDRTAATGIGYIAPVTSDGRKPSTLEIYAGRLWLAGVNHRLYSNKIYFTKVIERDVDFQACYQMNDPTSEYASDLLPSDGGMISIPDCGNVFKLWSIENALLIFASNGIWQISGSSGIGFAANDFVVKKISSLAVNSGTTFVDIAGFPAWWQDDGLYVITVDSQIGSTSVSSLTDTSIKTFYQDIPRGSKLYSKGAYDPIEKIIYWLYRDTEHSAIVDRFYYDRVLCFNVQTKAFWTWSVANTLVTPIGIVYTERTGIKYLIKNRTDNNVTFGNHGTTYRDWVGIPSATVSYTSFFSSGYKVHGDANKKFQSNYLNLYTDTSPEFIGRFKFQSIWDYAINTITGRFSQEQLVNFDNANYQYSNKRLKIRGHGKALQFRVESKDDEPFALIGWSGWETVNSGV